MQAAFPPQSLYVVRVHDTKFEPKLFLHLALPLFLEGSGAEYQDSAGSMAKKHLLDNEAGFDCLTETDVVGDQEIGARHVDRTNEWIQLIILNADATAERRLEVAAICVGGGSPDHRIKECLKR